MRSVFLVCRSELQEVKVGPSHHHVSWNPFCRMLYFYMSRYSTDLLDVYAYVLAVGGTLYTVTDVNGTRADFRF